MSQGLEFYAGFAFVKFMVIIIIINGKETGI